MKLIAAIILAYVALVVLVLAFGARLARHLDERLADDMDPDVLDALYDAPAFDPEATP